MNHHQSEITPARSYLATGQENQKSTINNPKSAIPSPYPGPRSFNEDESLYFKGRDEYLDDITKKLEKHHFLMVTGSSGDGKSSLIFAGLIPHARAGFLKAKFTDWVIADFRPKRDPLSNLAFALSKKLNINDTDKVEMELKLGFSALVDLYKKSSLYANGYQNPKSNLLILADQFEEFFTNEENYNPNTGVATQQAQHTVQLLLETARIARKENLPVYVVCTMRSDYFGNCNAFQGLPEMMEQSQKFLGRLSKQHVLEAISEPAKLSGIKISERLLQTLMNEITGDVGTDMLPILQHCLYQIYEVSGKGEEEMDLIHYAMVGGFPKENLPEKDRQQFEQWLNEQPSYLQKSYKNPSLRNVLDIHANRLYDSAHEYYRATSHTDKPISKQEAQHIIKVAFQCLTKIDENRAVRNLSSLLEVIEMLGYKKSEREKVANVLQIYRIQGNTFLGPLITKDPATKDLRLTTILDITHEALMRNWTKLEEWVLEEHEREIIYRDLVTQLNKWHEGGKVRGHLLSGGSLNYFEKWMKGFEVDEVAWLGRYMDTENVPNAPGVRNVQEYFEDIKEYLRVSRENINRKKKLERVAVGVICVLCVLAFIGFYRSEKQKALVKKISHSNEIATKAYMKLESDPTLAFRLAEQAYDIYPTKLAKQVIISAYGEIPFYKVLRGHTDFVSKAKFSPDGKYILTASMDNTARLWDAEGNLLHVLKGHTGPVLYQTEDAINFSYDSKYMVTTSADSNARVWDLKGQCIAILKGHQAAVLSACFSPAMENDSFLVLTASDDKTARLWDMQGNALKVFKGHKRFVSNAKFSPFFHHKKSKQRKILTVSFDNTARIWDLETDSYVILKGHTSAIYDANFSPPETGSKYIITASRDNTARLWNLEGRQLQVLEGHDDLVYSAKFSHDGKKIITISDDNSGKIWDLQRNVLHTLRGHTNTIWSLDLYGKENLLLTASDDGTARLWNYAGNELMVLKGHTDQVMSAFFSPNGKKVITASGDKTARLWNITPEEMPVLRGNSNFVMDALFSNNGQYIATAAYDQTARLWNSQGHLLKILKGHADYAITSIDFSPDDNFMITGAVYLDPLIIWDMAGNILYRVEKDRGSEAVQYSNNGDFILTKVWEEPTILLWDTACRLLQEFEHVSSYDLSADDRYLLTGSTEGSSIVLWQKNNTTQYKGCDTCIYTTVCTFKSHTATITSVVFSPSGTGNKYIVSTSQDSTAKIWVLPELEGNEKKLLSVKQPITTIQHPSLVTEAIISPNGKYFITIAMDNIIRVFTTEGRQFSTLNGHSDEITYAAFSPGNSYIVTASLDHTARVWDIEGNELQTLASHKAGVLKAIFSSDGKYILTASLDHTAHLIPWRVEDVLHKINVEKVRGDVWEMSVVDKKVYGIIE